MTEGFYNHLLTLIAKFVFAAISIAFTVIAVLAFFLTNISWISYVMVAFILVSVYFCASLFRFYEDFKSSLYLYFPKAVTPNANESSDGIMEELEEIALSNQELPLKVCQFYSKDCSFQEIAEKLSLNHPETAKRLLTKGLKTLLKSNGEKA